ncbi:MAG: SWF/SNF helicase family protein, partial [Paramuribaculum sp.]|nr:SWF/SNF helicase family protein [Paramuribaculum sp.]
DAGATGLNLQSASTAVNLDLPWNPALLAQRIARIYRMGQKNGVHVINMVSRDSIEERMLSVLSFKQSLFAGILDDGDDTVVLDENRFNRIMKLVDDEIARTDDNSDEDQEIPASLPIAEFEEQVKNRPEPHVADEASATRLSEADRGDVGEAETDNKDDAGGQRETSDAAAPSTEGLKRRNAEPIDGDRLMTQGVMFLSGLVEALKTPESTKALVDSLVKTDKKTGKSTMTIPIHDKTTLTNLLTALGALLNR